MESNKVSPKILVLNGPNLNMLGIREPLLYGQQNYAALEACVRTRARELGIEVTLMQSNYEGELVSLIQQAYGQFDGIIINAAAYSHTSIAILDALKAVNLPTVEVHLTDISQREAFRRHSFVSEYACRVFSGMGFEGYCRALECFV